MHFTWCLFFSAASCVKLSISTWQTFQTFEIQTDQNEVKLKKNGKRTYEHEICEIINLKNQRFSNFLHHFNEQILWLIIVICQVKRQYDMIDMKKIDILSGSQGVINGTHRYFKITFLEFLAWTFYSLFSFLCTLNWDFYFSEFSKSVSGYAIFVSFFFVHWHFSPLGRSHQST